MKRSDFAFAQTAQGLMNTIATPCGSACGSGDKPAEEKPAACGTACGAGDKPAEEKPAACGTACGAGDKK